MRLAQFVTPARRLAQGTGTLVRSTENARIVPRSSELTVTRHEEGYWPAGVVIDTSKLLPPAAHTGQPVTVNGVWTGTELAPSDGSDVLLHRPSAQVTTQTAPKDSIPALRVRQYSPRFRLGRERGFQTLWERRIIIDMGLAPRPDGSTQPIVITSDEAVTAAMVSRDLLDDVQIVPSPWSADLLDEISGHVIDYESVLSFGFEVDRRLRPRFVADLTHLDEALARRLERYPDGSFQLRLVVTPRIP